MIRLKFWWYWTRRQLICALKGHDPRELLIRSGTVKNIETQSPTLEYRCWRCFVELDRP